MLYFNAFDRSRSSADLWGNPPSCRGKPTLYLFLRHCCCTCMCPGHLCTAVLLSVTHKGTLGSIQPVEKALMFSKLGFMWRNKSSRISFLPALSLLGFTRSGCQRVSAHSPLCRALRPHMTSATVAEVLGVRWDGVFVIHKGGGKA